MRKLFPYLFIALIVINPVNTQSCPSGTYHNGQSCASCDSRCEVCMSATICTVCQSQAFLTIQEGGLGCKWCSELLPGCANCQSETVCRVCNEGFLLNETTCVSSSEMGGQVTIVNCQSYEVNIHGVCFTSIAYCSKYSNSGSCDSCENGNMLINGYCIPSGLVGNSSNNNQQSSNLNCQQRQYILNGHCADIGPQCLNFQSNGQCTECTSGFMVFNGLCVQQPAANSTVIVSYIPKINDPNLHTEQMSDTKDGTQISQIGSNTVQSIPTSHQDQQNISAASQCSSPCATCSQDQSYCHSCIGGFTTVDQFPGKCFPL